jgi:hypothetical protein
MIRGATSEWKTKRYVRLVKPVAVRQGKGHDVSLPLLLVDLVPSSGSFAAPLSLPLDTTTQRERQSSLAIRAMAHKKKSELLTMAIVW